MNVVLSDSLLEANMSILSGEDHVRPRRGPPSLSFLFLLGG